MKSIMDNGFIVYDDGIIKNQSGMNNDGTNKKDTWRFYCDYDNCTKFIKVKWGGGYGCVTSETGQMCDMRNESWYCTKHSVVDRLIGRPVEVQDYIK